ncbi:TPA: YebC/PmpR family DNA-binding transcriptional regulator, partial [Pasteurella multocida]|nr:YebC/PmpR family DNA-binding transcriptional regulator [Pasteurella multocida]
QDAQRGKIFTKLIRELVTAAKLGGGDVNANPRLRTAVDKALSSNMTRDTINRAIERGVGGGDDTNMETKIYEGYGPGGTAVMVECLSDNANRTISQVRPSFTKCGGNLGTEGSVGYLFSKKGLILITSGDEDVIMEAAIEAGADDVQVQEDGSFEVYTAWEELGAVRDGIESAGIKIDNAEVTMIPSTTVELDAETAPKLLKLIDMLEDCDDVQNVYHNGEISDEIAAML